jgi:hypothetical protein
MRLLPLSSSFFLFTMLVLTGCGDQAPPTIAVEPTNQNVIAGQAATFSVTAAGAGPVSYQWQKSGAPISGATFPKYTTPPTTLSDNGSDFSVVISTSKETVTSNSASLTVNAATDVLTYHNDIARTGQNLTEFILSPGNVNMAQFGKIGFYPVDGLVDAQPLYASAVAVPNNGSHNLLIAATENASVYAFDADSGATIWHVSVLKPGETPSDDPSHPTSASLIGVNATPVIDRSIGPHGAIYVVTSSATRENGSVSTYYQRLHALDLALGTELFGGPVDIHATYPGFGDSTNDTSVVFYPKQYRERCALLLLNGVVYTTWASHYDYRPYTGWIIGYSESTLAQTTVLNVTPNGNAGAIWMSGAGPAADSSGNIYFLDANGTFDPTLDSNGFPVGGDYGNAFLKLSTVHNQLSVADYFEMDNGESESVGDVDLGSGGALVLPDLNDASGHTMHLAVGAGKDGNLYVVNRDSMGKLTPNNSGIYQQLTGALGIGVWGMPAYFNDTIYYGPWGSPILAFTISNAKLSTNPTIKSPNSFGYPGTTPGVSANGKSNGIVWAVDNGSVGGALASGTAVLHAYSASSLNEIYNSNQASGGRDGFGTGNKFITPTIVNGKVFVGTPNGVAVFGLLSQ